MPHDPLFTSLLCIGEVEKSKTLIGNRNRMQAVSFPQL